MFNPSMIEIEKKKNINRVIISYKEMSIILQKFVLLGLFRWIANEYEKHFARISKWA